MITSNALGHDVYSRNNRTPIDEAKKIEALETAMRTINNAYREKPSKRAGALKHCPATFLVRKGDGACPVLKKDMAGFAPDHYEGHFNTDHLLPSVFFQDARDAKDIPLHRDLGLSYIYDGVADPDDHADLMLGSAATWFDVKRNIDRLPRTVDPETVATLTPKMEGQLKNWAADRLKGRL